MTRPSVRERAGSVSAGWLATSRPNGHRRAHKETAMLFAIVSFLVHPIRFIRDRRAWDEPTKTRRPAGWGT